jgi:DNA (cytosine-5)-methyltransferase 1
MTAYYNEIDPYAAQWLRNLIDAGHIAPGVVDERSIEDVKPDELREFTQCHFFAGIGVWSLALRRAGWSDDRPVWTGSCPCQPFSAAGKGTAFDDERHLWPAWHWLIQECRPPVVFGEQVASKGAEPWLDLVSNDLENLGFAFGAVAFPSASVGAPHIRDRTYFVAHAGGTGLEGSTPGTVGRQRAAAERGSRAGRLADATNSGFERRGSSEEGNGRDATWIESERFCDARRMADAGSFGRLGRQRVSAGGNDGGTDAGRIEGDHGLVGICEAGNGSQTAGPTNGFWRNSDWLLCRDGKWRPVEPGTFPLAHGASSRVGRLRAYGNAINAQAAQIFIESAMMVDNK